jgi:hypothetical protein
MIVAEDMVIIVLIRWDMDRANEHTLNNNKKTIMPGDVFAALDDTEFPFFRERLEAEFKSSLAQPHLLANRPKVSYLRTKLMLTISLPFRI